MPMLRQIMANTSYATPIPPQKPMKNTNQTLQEESGYRAAFAVFDKLSRARALFLTIPAVIYSHGVIQPDNQGDDTHVRGDGAVVQSSQETMREPIEMATYSKRLRGKHDIEQSTP